jgi:N6-adenosine-specific RNA methylase IME4
MMKIAGREIHPAANLFPMIGDEQLRELAEDIKAHGLLEPIVLHPDGPVIDGRNRLRACEIAGVAPRFAIWSDHEQRMGPTGWVLSKNLKRRHLNPSQAAAVALSALPLLEKEAKERQKAALKKGGAQAPPSAPRGANGKAATHAAEAVGIGTRTLERAKAIAEKAPALMDKIRDGELTVKQAEKQIRKTEQVRAVKAYRPPEGRFQVIADDPAWPFDDRLDGSDAARGGLTYPSQTLAEICAEPPPADKDCVLFLWCPNTHLADGSVAKVLAAWGFTPKTIITWDKVNMGLGSYLRNVTEHCVVAVRGNPVITLTNQTTIIREPRREHSRKPERFYQLVEEICPSTSRLELHSRTSRPGWVTAGAEEGQFDPPAKVAGEGRTSKAAPKESEAEGWVCDHDGKCKTPVKTPGDRCPPHEAENAKRMAELGQAKAGSDRHPAESIACPACLVRPGKPCLTGSGAERGWPHEPRIKEHAKRPCVGFPPGSCSVRVNPGGTGQCRKCAIAETNAAKKAAKSSRDGLCEKQGKDAVKRCQLKAGHRGKCDLKPLKQQAAK